MILICIFGMTNEKEQHFAELLPRFWGEVFAYSNIFPCLVRLDIILMIESAEQFIYSRNKFFLFCQKFLSVHSLSF